MLPKEEETHKRSFIECLVHFYLEDPSSADMGLIPLGPEFAIPPLAKSTISFSN